jgi:hypothetical protein
MSDKPKERTIPGVIVDEDTGRVVGTAVAVVREVTEEERRDVEADATRRTRAARFREHLEDRRN